MRIPDGYERAAARNATFIVRHGLTGFVRAAIDTDGSLHAFALAHAERTMPGRGAAPACVIDSPVGRLVVRHYLRGGGVRALGDRYLRFGTPRPFQELLASAAARERGIATPVVAAAIVYAAGVYYRGDIATGWIADSTTLADITFGRERRSPAEQRPAWRAAGRLVKAAAEAGVAHADLNARNVLIEWSADGPAPYLLDLDRCTIVDEPAGRVFERLAARLRRSARKLERETGDPADEVLAAFEEGAGG